MITVSRAFRQELDYNRRNYLSYADITLSTGRTLSLTNSEIWSGGFSTEDAVSEDEKFTALGSTVIGAATLIINNMDESYSSYDFINATVALYTGLWVGSGSSSRLEKIKKGTYTVDDTRYNGGTITLTLLDNMAQFDRPYSTSTLQYPATLDAIVRDACLKCGVLLNTYSFPHKDYVVKAKPQAEAVTYREVVGWAACIAGCFARCNRDGKLELRWFDQDTLETRTDVIDGGRSFDSTSSTASIDGGGFDTAYETIDGGNLYDDDGMHYVHSLYSQDISMDDVVITGVRVTVKNEQEGASTATLDFSAGTSGYVIGVEGNEFITPETGQDVATWLGAQLIGLRFRKASVTHASDPSIEAGDIGILWDRKDNEYPILITRSNFSTNTSQTTVCGAETPSRNNATRYGWQTKSYVDSRRLLFEEESLRNKMLKDLSDRLAAKSGLYSTVEIQEGGDSVYYLHDMPTLDESSIVWKMTREAWGVTTDYNHGVDTVWNGGMTVDGDAIVRILSAIGVDADWITTGTIVVKDRDGDVTFSADTQTGEVHIVATEFSLSGKTIQEIADAAASSAASGAVSGLTQKQIFDILTNNSQNNGIHLIDGVLYLDFSYAEGGTLKLGGENNGRGVLEVYASLPVNNVPSGAERECLARKISQTGEMIYNIPGSGTFFPNAFSAPNNTSTTYAYYRNLYKDSDNKYHVDSYTDILATQIDPAFEIESYENSNTKYYGYRMTTRALDIRLRERYAMLSYYDSSVSAYRVIGYYSSDGIHIMDYSTFTRGIEMIVPYGKGINKDGEEYDFACRSIFASDTIKCDYLYADVVYADSLHLTTSPDSYGQITDQTNLLAYSSTTQAIKIATRASSKRYKIVGRQVTAEDVASAYDINVYMARYKPGFLEKGDRRENVEYPMFIAEQMYEHIPNAVDLNEKGECEAWNEVVLIPIMFQMIKDQKATIDEQQKTIDEQQQRIDDLEDRLAKLEEAIRCQSRR